VTFYVVLALINIACFLPMYALNIREQPNPFAFLRDTEYFSKATLRLLYTRKRYTDPFRINFDFTFLMLIASYFETTSQWALGGLTLILVFGYVEILYSTIMLLIFRRAPSLTSDIALLKAGWSVAHRYRYLIVIATIALLAGLIVLAKAVVQYAYAFAPNGQPALLLMATFLIAPCLYHWRGALYSEFIWRVTYSPVLHLYRNIEFSRRTKGIVAKDGEYFDRLNPFKAIRFDRGPDIVLVCIESYGSIVFKDPAMRAAIADTAKAFNEQLHAHDYSIASNFTEAPIFAGGSWLSYSSLTYGTLFDDAYVYDSLFDNKSAFGSYESLFHILERNGYANNLLCPLGGVASRYVNWDSIDRCFRPQRIFDFDSLNYQGNAHSFFVPNDLYAAPDQYSLNYAYDSISNSGSSPFSLFFCTLNSHYPWTSNFDVVGDWRQLNDQSAPSAATGKHADARTAYIQSIKYQLEYILKFIIDNAGDDLLLIAFGDHQPPMITPESMGKHTPIHVIARHPDLIVEFLDNGFAPTLDISDLQVVPIKHQGFLSLLMRAMNVSHGQDPELRIDYRENGTPLVDAN
jgi:hypothetical protein